MENLDLDIILGLTGGGGLFAALWKGLPYLLDYLKDKRSAANTLSIQSMSAAGLSVGYMASVLDTLQARIVQMKADHAQEFTALAESYEKLRVRSEKRIQELLDEIDGLKRTLAKLGKEK